MQEWKEIYLLSRYDPGNLGDIVQGGQLTRLSDLTGYKGLWAGLVVLIGHGYRAQKLAHIFDVDFLNTNRPFSIYKRLSILPFKEFAKRSCQAGRTWSVAEEERFARRVLTFSGSLLTRGLRAMD